MGLRCRRLTAPLTRVATLFLRSPKDLCFSVSRCMKPGLTRLLRCAKGKQNSFKPAACSFKAVFLFVFALRLKGGTAALKGHVRPMA